jgi:hypothetical protein
MEGRADRGLDAGEGCTMGRREGGEDGVNCIGCVRVLEVEEAMAVGGEGEDVCWGWGGRVLRRFRVDGGGRGVEAVERAGRC